MSEIISFPVKEVEEWWWKCHCGSTTFHLLEEGDVECSECETISLEMKCFDSSLKPGEGWQK